jgi:hypothetical protein
MKTYKRKYNTPEYRKRYTGIYGSWYAMKQRCNNPKNKQYKDYGGRGIKYIPAWDTFETFEKDMSLEYQKNLTLDRIDNSKGYSKENCRWATRKQQNQNKRCNIVLELNGETKTLLEWSKDINMGYDTLRSRFYRKMKPIEILKTDLYRPATIIKK